LQSRMCEQNENPISHGRRVGVFDRNVELPSSTPELSSRSTI
jgi:hypothetical protein